MELTLKDVGVIIKKNWIVIVAFTIAGILLGYGLSAFMVQKEYEATTMMIVSTTMQSPDKPITMTSSDYDLNAKLVNSYSVLCKSDRILSQVRDKLGINMELDKLAEKIDITSKQNTDIISLSVKDPSPQMAQNIANTLVDVFKNEVILIMKMDNVQVIDYAILPQMPVSPNIPVNTVVCSLLGLVAALVFSVLRYMTDDTIKESELITGIIGLPVIGNVPKMN
jgi:capsular polysaccharide biosynthesis protein